MKLALSTATSLCVLLFCTAVGTAVGTPLQIDFGLDEQATAAVGWNNMTGVTGFDPGNLPDLVDSSGTSTGIGLTYTKSGGSAGVSGTAANYEGAYPAVVATLPPTALKDGLFYQSGVEITLTLSNLDPQMDYAFTLYGSRGNNGADTSYTVSGSPGSSRAEVVSNVLNNATEVIEIGGIAPTAAGDIEILLVPLTNVAGSSGALNIMTVTSSPRAATAWSVEEFDATSDLSTTGTLIYAENHNGETAIVNGIEFVGRIDEGANKSSSVVQTLLGNQAALDDVYDDQVPELSPLLERFWWGLSPASTGIRLTGLTSGNTYLVQFGLADDRDDGSIPGRYAFAGDIGGNTGADPVGPTNTIYGGSDGPALLFSGIFTATSVVQSFPAGIILADGTFISNRLSFLQLREIRSGSVFAITEIVLSAEGPMFTFNSTPSEQYAIERSTDLEAWEELTDNYPDGGATGVTTSYTDTRLDIDFPDGTPPELFYRAGRID